MWADYVDSWALAYPDLAKGKEGPFSICTDVFPEIKQPTLVLYGDEDWLGAGLEQAGRNAKAIPNGRLVLGQFGRHDLHIQLRDWFNSCVQRFLLQ